MAQGSYNFRNVSDQIKEDWIPNHLGTNYSYQLDVDNFKCVDNFLLSTTIKRLSLKRRSRVAINNGEKPQSGIAHSKWHSAESLSSSNRDETRLLGMLSSATRGRPPLPPQHSSYLDSKPSKNEGPIEPAVSRILNESKPQPSERALASQRQSPMMKKTTIENNKQLDQEMTNQPVPQPHPRRRLASFGGVSSPGSLSPFTGLGAYNQNNNGYKPTGTGVEMHLSSSHSSRGSTGCLRLSPEGSGRTTSATGLGTIPLQHVRDQMVVALQKLKELEEQVKIIPILQVKISVLQEEKRQLGSQLKNRNDSDDMNDATWKKACGMEKCDIGNKGNADKVLEDIVRSDCTDLGEFRQITAEMQALERTIKGGSLQGWHGRGQNIQNENGIKSVTVGTDKVVDITLSKPLKENKYVSTDQVERRSIGTEVSEICLGIYTEREAEIDAQQLIIGALKEKIRHLEAELKESALQTEMRRLKLELQAAGARNRVDTVGTTIEARSNTTTKGLGNHKEFRDASTGEEIEVKNIGICCRPELKDVCIGPDVPMNHWEIRERVEIMEKGVGNHVFTNTQGVGMEIKLCDAETNTEVNEGHLGTKKENIKYNTVACGDCSVDVIICEAKALSQTASQRTNTIITSVSRSTNTRPAFILDSGTNTVLNTKDKHTNTIQAITKTVSVGSGVKETCTGFASLLANASKETLATITKATRDTGVGFTNINENFLVGLKTRNMASGPSHLPDPSRTRSIGVGEGRIQDLSGSSSNAGQEIQQSLQSKCDPKLNHYIGKMHRLPREHGDMPTENYTLQREAFVHSQQESATPKLSNTSKAAIQGGTETHPLDTQPPVTRKLRSPSQPSLDSSQHHTTKICREGANDSEVKRMIQMLEQQTSSALQDRSSNVSKLRSAVKKQNGDQGSSSNRKSMKLLRVTTGLDPMSSCQEGEKRGNKKLRESSQDGVQAKKGKGASIKASKVYARSQTQQRGKLNEKMFAACQALTVYLNGINRDGTALSSRELHDCLQTLQQEWFSVSSQKSAVPDTVENYLSSFRAISFSVLQHIVNMADGNGNTALHYSVSHSNFGIVKKLLDAEVCNVNHQNKAGYTPIMLAALAAVESPAEMKVVEQLFSKGDVNAKASQAGQTALMLAVSHGRMGMVQALLAQGAEVNLQDDEGSTALMCASEHGHADIVRLLLAQPCCNATLTDSDDSTALSIALEAGHSNIAVLLYAHANFSKGQAGLSGSHISY